jgi:hypothetical protein
MYLQGIDTQMKLAEPKNKNYCAVVVKLDRFADLTGCDNVKAALIFGNSVIVGKDTQAGAVGLFFPVETQLTRDFLANNNLFRKPEWGNVDSEKKGFFEEHGRVKAVKFRGHKSEGFWIPLESLLYLEVPLSEFPVGAEFDTVGDRVICRKYVPRYQSRVGSGPKTAKTPRNEDKIVEGQFRFHIDTENLRRNVHKIEPGMWISISDKWHGTSAVFANVLVKRELRWWEKLLKKLGVHVQEQEYGFTWSSRKVIKGVNGETRNDHNHFYSEDIWGVVAQEIQSLVPKGITLYGEIVGYTTDGAPIQKGYHYGCQPGQHRFLVYRITYTNPDGKVFEFGWQQMKEFCAKYGLEMVKELWYGQAHAFANTHYPTIEEPFEERLLRGIEQYFVDEKACPYNNNEVPAEGVVVKVDKLDEAVAYKLKNFSFLAYETKQLDKGETDVETVESEA